MTIRKTSYQNVQILLETAIPPQQRPYIKQRLDSFFMNDVGLLKIEIKEIMIKYCTKKEWNKQQRSGGQYLYIRKWLWNIVCVNQLSQSK